MVWVSTMDEKEDAAQALSKYGFLAMPVVDLENRLVGIVTVDDAMDVTRRRPPRASRRWPLCCPPTSPI